MIKKLTRILFIIAFIGVFTYSYTEKTNTTYASTWTGAGTVEDPYVLYTANDFYEFSVAINKYANNHFILGNDLDFSGKFFIPFGNEIYPFKGTFDGNGYTIFNVHSAEYMGYRGVFGRIEEAGLNNIKVKNLNISGSGEIGGLVGYSTNSQISNCSVEGVIEGNQDTGGLVGVLSGGSIINSYADVTVKGGSGGNIGGLVGMTSSGSEISNSYVKGNVTGVTKVGGLVGMNSGTIRESFADVDVKTQLQSNNFGGLVGTNDGKILDSYVVGIVEGAFVGGLVGNNNVGAEISNSYAANQIKSNGYRIGGQLIFYAGGLVNYHEGMISNSFWDISTSNQVKIKDDGNGSIIDSSGKTTQDMQTQATYTNWDFDNVWTIHANAYPHLQKANLIELDSSNRILKIGWGEEASIHLSAVYSNGTKEDVTDSAVIELISLPETISSISSGQLNIIGGQKAKGHIKVSYGGVTNYFPVNVASGPMSVSKSTVIAQSSSIVADGSTTTDIEVKVVDEDNTPKEGLNVTLYGDDHGVSTILPTQQTTDQNGKAVFKVASTKAEIVKYNAEVEEAGINKRLDQEATVTFLPGEPAVSQSNITVISTGPYTVGKDTSKINVTIKDQYANSIANTLVELLPSQTTPTDFQTIITPVNPWTDANGSIDFEVSSTWAKTITFTTKINGVEIPTLSTTVTFIPDVIDSSHSIIVMDNHPIIVGESREVLVQMKDQYGNPSISGVDTSQIAWDSSMKGNIVFDNDNGEGEYTFTYTAPKTAGNDTIKGIVSGNPLANSISLSIIPSSVAKATIEPATPKVVVGNELLLTLTLTDQYDNFVDEHAISLVQKIGAATIITSLNNGLTSNGIAEFKVSSTKAETVMYEVHAEGKPTGITFDVQFAVGNIDVNHSKFTQNKATAIANDQDLIQLTITLMDQHGNPVPNMKVEVIAPEKSSASPSQEDVDITDVEGSVSFDLKNEVAGEHTFSIIYEQYGNRYWLKDYVVTFTAGSVDIHKSSLIVTKRKATADGIDAAEIFITLVDQYQNPVPDTNIVVSTSNTNVMVDSMVTTTTNGEARLKAKSFVAENVQINVSVDDPNLSDPLLEEIEITFVPGPISKSTSVVTSDTSIMRADQQQSATITVELKDANNNLIPNQRVALQQSGSSIITPASAYADGNDAITDQSGTAQFTITSTKAEAVVYTATVTNPTDGVVTLNQTITINITSGSVYSGNTEMAISSDRLVADGISASTITVQLKDEFGNNLTVDGGLVEIYANSDALTVTQAVYGTYTATLTASTITGKAMITAYIIDENNNHALIPVQKEIHFIPGPAVVGTSTIQSGQSSLYADGSSQTVITVQLRDQNGNDLTDETMHGHVVDIITNLGSISPTVYKEDGQYEAVLTASHNIGTATLTAKLNQEFIKDQTLIDFTLGPLSLAKSTITADPSSLMADGKSTTIIQVQLMDDYGHKIERNEGEVVLTSTLGTMSTVDYVAGGLYQATLTVGTTTGKAMITGTLNGDPLLAKAEVSLTTIPSPTPRPDPDLPPSPEPEPRPVPDTPLPTPTNSVPGNGNQGNFAIYDEDGKEATVSFSDVELRSDQALMITTNWSNGEAMLSFSSLTLGHIQQVNPTQQIEVQVENILYQLPVNQLDIDRISELLGSREFEITIEFKAANEHISTSALATAEQLGADLLHTPIEFTIIARADNGNSIELRSFTQYVTRTFAIDGNMDTYYVTGVRYHLDTEEYEPVPTTFEIQGNKTMVHLHSLSNSYYTVIKNDITFSDMLTHWAKTEVERMANKWIIKGKGNHRFDPSGTLTRAEAITLLVRALGLNEVTEDSPYDDVTNEWYAGAVITASKAGLIVENEVLRNKNQLKPLEEISREELAQMLVQAMKRAGMTFDRAAVHPITRFNDIHRVSDWARDSVATAVHAGIIKGDDRGFFNPNNTTSRAEAAVMLDRLLRVLGLSN